MDEKEALNFQDSNHRVKGKTDNPMQVFISYAHTEKDLCDEIIRALKERGHHPWYDEEKIDHGNDWRERITRGITDSQAVVSCLSRNAVRKGGVCLDELSIAVGVKGGNIQTILLEPEKDVCPPASVCHIQWLDMSGWRKMKAQGDAVFQPWFDGKMKELIEIIESKENRAFAGEIEEIKRRLPINYSTSKQKRLLQNHIVGREWLIRNLEDWLDDPNGARLCVLYGEPGVGKSAFVAKYIHYNPHVVAGLFCEYDNPYYNDTKIIASTLAFLLACRLPHYRVILTDILEHEKRLGELNSSELFDLLLANPLSGMNIDGGQETLCIVIDGLDECAQGEFNALADTLSNQVPRLPKWLRVLVTSREVSAVTAPLAGAFRMELRAKQEQNLDDIREYYTEQLKGRFGHEAEWESALEILTERSGGIFQYAVLVADGILKNKMKLTEADTLPEGLAAVYHRWFGWFFPEKDMAEYKRLFRPALGMILAAPEPLPSEELCRVLDWDEDQLGEFIRKISVLLQRGENVFHKETLSFSHAYLNQWLDMDAAANPYACNRRTGERRLAQGFYTLFQKNVKKLTEFEALHLTDLLVRCGETEATQEAEMSHDLLQRIIETGDYCNTWGSLSLALKCFKQAWDMAEKMANQEDTYKVRRIFGDSCNKVANILMEMGDLNGALEMHQKSLNIREQLAKELNTPDVRRDLSDSYNNLAIILKETGDLDGALEIHQKSLNIRERLEKELNTPDSRRDLSGSYNNLAVTLVKTGDLNGALELFQKSLTIRKRLVEELNTPQDQRNLGNSYDNLSGILKGTGDLNGALEFSQKSLNIQERLTEELNTPQNRRILSASYNNLANILVEIGDLDGALKIHQKSLTIQERLAEELNTPQTRSTLSASYFNLAVILKETGDLNGALVLYQKSLNIRERLAKELNTPDVRRDLSDSYNNLAVTLAETGDLDGALEMHQKSLNIRERLAKELNTPESRRGLSESYNNLAVTLAETGDLDGALEMHQKSLTIQERLAEELNTPQHRRNLSISYYNLANIIVETGNLDGTLELYQKSLNIQERLAEELNTPQDRRNLSASYNNLAKILLEIGDLDGALKIHQKGLNIQERLVEELNTPQDQRDLGTSYNNLAKILKETGDLDGALELYQKSLTIQERLAEELNTPQDQRDLSISYYNVAVVLRQLHIQPERPNILHSFFHWRKKATSPCVTSVVFPNDNASELLLKALEIVKKLVKDFGLPEDKQLSELIYNGAKSFLGEEDDTDALIELYKQIQDIPLEVP